MDLTQLDPEVVRGEISRRSLLEFWKQFWSITEPAYQRLDNWHLDCLADHLAHAFEIGRLLINVPPRTGKTLLAAVAFPAWLWIHKPSTRFLWSQSFLPLVPPGHTQRNAPSSYSSDCGASGGSSE